MRRNNVFLQINVTIVGWTHTTIVTTTEINLENQGDRNGSSRIATSGLAASAFATAVRPIAIALRKTIETGGGLHTHHNLHREAGIPEELRA